LDSGSTLVSLYAGSDEVIEDIIPMFIQFWSNSGKASEHMYPGNIFV
jgi:hypothetical protein